MADELRLVDLRHPDFTIHLDEWQLWRDTYDAGRQFIEKYLKTFSDREDITDFAKRKEMTYCPAFAASAIDDVKNSIYQRMTDITRAEGPKSYQDALTGYGGGVDLVGSSMNYFIGQKILPELLTMHKVGVYVDMPPILPGATEMAVRALNIRPYTYIYKAEEICAWQYDESASMTEYSAILLLETYNRLHPKFGFPYETAQRYRYMYINEEGFVVCQYFDLENNPIDEYGRSQSEPTILSIRKIPFVCFQLPYSLLKDVARYQVALLNVESSDINYILRANFPFYTEQQDFRANSPHLKGGDPNLPGEAGRTQATREIDVGAASGRAYGPGMNPPAFIHPSPDPLKASMEKQDRLKQDIRLLINLALTNMTPTKQQSVESKAMDNQGLESGLSFIGLELEKGERQIAEYWAMYESTKPATVNYPTKYSLKSDNERREESKQIIATIPQVPSLTFQKEMAKALVVNEIGHKVSRETLQKMFGEIDKAPFISVDPITLQQDVQLGFLSKEYASKGRMYPDDNVTKADKEHAERLATIAESQAQAAATKVAASGAARGVPDTSADPKADVNAEKTAAKDNSKDPVATTKQRGAGK